MANVMTVLKGVLCLGLGALMLFFVLARGHEWWYGALGAIIFIFGIVELFEGLGLKVTSTKTP